MQPSSLLLSASDIDRLDLEKVITDALTKRLKAEEDAAFDEWITRVMPNPRGSEAEDRGGRRRE